MFVSYHFENHVVYPKITMADTRVVQMRLNCMHFSFQSFNMVSNVFNHFIDLHISFMSKSKFVIFKPSLVSTHKLMIMRCCQRFQFWCKGRLMESCQERNHLFLHGSNVHARKPQWVRSPYAFPFNLFHNIKWSVQESWISLEVNNFWYFEV